MTVEVLGFLATHARVIAPTVAPKPCEQVSVYRGRSVKERTLGNLCEFTNFLNPPSADGMIGKCRSSVYGPVCESLGYIIPPAR
jgi:hypothetical protein